MAHPGGIGVDRLSHQQFITDGQDFHQKPPGCHHRSADGQALDAARTGATDLHSVNAGCQI